MCLRTLVICAVLLCSPLLALADEGHSHQGHKLTATELGSVDFPISCSKAAQKDFTRAVALLHSFWYEEAGNQFSALAQREPSCAMAYWGVAMSHYHPLWEPPKPAEIEASAAALEKARAVKKVTPRERAYVEAIAAYYDGHDKTDHRTRAAAYEQAMERVHREYSKDDEAAIFYSLALISTAKPTDKTYDHQRRAGAILEPLFQRRPTHPGLAHYIIHSYDNAVLAPLGLNAARRYAKIAPAVPHALHMPSHIFTRLGLWQDSIDTNAASAATAKVQAEKGSKLAYNERLHAMDYMAYAFLQLGRDEEAEKLAVTASQLAEGPRQIAGNYSLAALPARVAIERHRWADAAALPVLIGDYLPTKSITHWARAIGMARTGDVKSARGELATLNDIHSKLATSEPYWATLVDVQRKQAEAWIVNAEGHSAKSLELLRAAADLEDSTDKHPVTPGAITPAREMLAAYLLEHDQAAAALPEYEKSLKNSPRRFNGVYGAAKAAQKSGQRELAAKYYKQLAELAGPETTRTELKEAKAYMASR